ncbi:dynein intermediate chain 2, axonemal-like [Cimex lectularius]|uniref:Dynein intermediate chain 3, ciliary n=1 Tax=Cimex lectularius TaxID=79782 RepID=A0A8I6RN07_CIMLE|nr:dynein intermediate chain 2, axonemal-like [Cimex lectularius]
MEGEESEEKHAETKLETTSLPDAGEDRPFRLEISYVYTRVRKNFGRPLRLTPMAPKFLVQMPPNDELKELHIRLEPAPISTQVELQMSAHEVDAQATPYTRRTQKHVEGGYPIEVNTADLDMVVRYQKKQGKGEELFRVLPILIGRMERCLNQNNSTDLYERYFTPPHFEEEAPNRPLKVKTVYTFKDPMTPFRPTVDVAWEPGSEVRLASAHCVLDFGRVDYTRDTYSYVWNLMNPNRPELVLDAGMQTSCLEFNPKEKRIICGGLCSGQMCFWDTRKGSKPVAFSNIYESFRDIPTCVLWINSKTGTECFSSASDGQVLWWDTRSLKEPIDKLLLDLSKSDEQLFPRATGISKLGYEHTMPNKFMAGTENGSLVVLNRKGKTLNEKVGTIFNCHHTPIRACKRNPGYLKIFMTAGDWRVKIWSEDCKEQEIFSTRYETTQIAGCTWAPNRGSVFYVAKKDASLDVWDLLYKTDVPMITHKLGTVPFTCLKENEDGTHLAIGDENGNTNLVEMSDHFTEMDKADRAHINGYFDLEGHREKLIEAKNREVRLRARTAGEETEKPKMPIMEMRTNAFVEFNQRLEKFEMDLNSRIASNMDMSSVNIHEKSSTIGDRSISIGADKSFPSTTSA